MAEYGEWTRKGATLSDVTARKDYGVDSDFIVKGINAGKLEYREGAIHGNPYIRLLRSQLEAYIAEELGVDYLHRWQQTTELREINREMAQLRKRLDETRVKKSRDRRSALTTSRPRRELTFALADEPGSHRRVTATGVRAGTHDERPVTALPQGALQ